VEVVDFITYLRTDLYICRKNNLIMTINYKHIVRTMLCVALLAFSVYANSQSTKPVTPNSTPEAVALLNYIHSISGKNTLAGQHCAPLVGSTRLAVVHRITQQYPAVFGQDFGFSYPGYWDGINYRQNIVDEAIRRHQEGFIITLMWHAVNPTLDEPVEFKDGIQSELTDKQWEDLITPGTNLHERWKSQVDVIAWFLKQLRYANVPVIWRPYHEMNGDWFWWGKKPGNNGYKKLYQMMFDRFVNFHGLNNLIWVYNTNEFKPGVDRHDTYYPGDNFVDVLATDVYTHGFDQENYNQMVALSGGKKPIALGEVGAPPSPDKLKEQPKWAWFMTWGEPAGKATTDAYANTQVLKLKDLPWGHVDQPKVHYPILR
jgi:mannan endo-1,4-beta-mannosidase